MAVWGIRHDEKFLFSTSPRSVKARNLAKNPRCVVCPERADEAVVLEGNVEVVGDAATLKKFRRDYKQKYDWDMEKHPDPTYAVRPLVAFGFIEKPENFSQTATKVELSKTPPLKGCLREGAWEENTEPYLTGSA